MIYAGGIGQVKKLAYVQLRDYSYVKGGSVVLSYPPTTRHERSH